VLTKFKKVIAVNEVKMRRSEAEFSVTQSQEGFVGEVQSSSVAFGIF